MATSSRFLLLILVISSFFITFSTSQDCGQVVTGLTGCAPYLADPTTKPDQTKCCAPLKTALADSASIQCICAVQNSSTAQSLNFKNALTLPQACSLSVVVSEANCTGSSSSPSSTSPGSSGTPAGKTPVSTATTDKSAGFMCSTPFSAAVLLALLFVCASLLS